MKKRFLLTTFFLILFGSITYGQHSRKIGLSGTIQGSQFGILIPMWLGEKFVLAPAFDIKSAEKVGTDISLGLAPRFYTRTGDLMPYFGLKFGIITYKSSGGSKKTKDLVGGIAFGGEYFFADNFSLGIEAQGNLTKSDKDSYRFGHADGIIFNTATMVLATIYF